MTESEVFEARAFAFVNTMPSRRQPDAFRTPRDTCRWIFRRLGVEGDPPTLPTQRRLQDEALRLRRAALDLLIATAADAEHPSAALLTIDRALAAGRWTRRLDRSRLLDRASGVQPWTDTLEVGTDPLALLSPFAADLLLVVATVAPARIRSCAADDCPRWFADSSKSGRRRWCSMSTCGNRAKAARYRDRHADEA